MKYLFLAALLATGLVACGDDKEKDEKSEVQKPVELKSDKDKISYSIGIQQGSQIMGSQNPNRDKFDKGQLIAGFKAGFTEVSEQKKSACMMTLQNMMGGGQGMPFNEAYAKEGCNCIGMLTASDIYAQFSKFEMADRIDQEMLNRGFEDGLNGVANKVSEQDQQALFEALNKDFMAADEMRLAKIEEQYKSRWDEIKAIPGIKELDNGIYLQTLKQGSGGKPSVGEDIEASYVLKRFDGSIKETSEKLPEGKFQANLSPGSLIQGWVIGFQQMQVGGKYRLYVPSAMAYGQEPLDFEIEFFQKGAAGTLFKQQMPPM